MCVSARPAESAARSQTSTGTHAPERSQTSTGTHARCLHAYHGWTTNHGSGSAGRRLAFEPSLPRARDYVRARLGLGLLRSMLAPMALRHGAAAGGIHKMLSRLAVRRCDSGLLPAQVTRAAMARGASKASARCCTHNLGARASWRL